MLQNKSNMVAKNTFRGGVSEREFDGGKNKNTAIAAHAARIFTFTKNFIASALLAFVTSAHGLLTTENDEKNNSSKNKGTRKSE